MGQFLITGLINIGVGLAINALFGEDIEVEGPRLSDRNVSASTYGRFVDISWGTDRHEGNLIDTTDPPIEEVSSSDSSRTGKGIGPTVKTTEYQYFHTGRWSFGVSGAKSVLKIFVNRKLVYDATAPDGPQEQGVPGFIQRIKREQVDFTLYPGGSTQEKDPGEVARRGEVNAQGYRHLTTIVFNRLPLKDIGNTIQSVSAIIAYNDQQKLPFEFMDEPASFSVPSGGDPDYMMIDPANDKFYSLGRNGSNFWAGNLGPFTFAAGALVGAFSTPIADLSGRMYSQDGSNNSVPVTQYDAETGQALASFGATSIDTTDDPDSIGNSGTWGHLQATVPGIAAIDYLVHLNEFGQPNGSILKAAQGQFFYELQLGPAQGFVGTDGYFIGDHDRNRGFFVTGDGAGGVRLTQMDTTFSVDPTVGTQLGLTFTNIRDFTAGSPGDDFPDGNARLGFAVDRTTGNLLLSNGANLVLYNPDSDTIIAKRSDVGFRSRFNYYSGTIFAFTDGGTSVLVTVDTRDLTTKSSVDMDTFPWPNGDGEPHPTSTVWDDERQAIIFSRVNGNKDQRITRVFVNRVEGLGVPLDELARDLMTSYQGLELGGLSTGDFDVTPLVGKTVEGLTINNRSTLRDVFNILRRRFFFDVVVSDWIFKFVFRGGTPVFTIPAELIGQLSEDTVNSPPVERTQTDESDLPMRLNVGYRNKEMGYNPDVEHDKRQRAPDPIVNTKDEQRIDLSMVDTSTAIKRVASNWLWTMWQERGQNRFKLPWHYIALDPADVIDITVFDEVVRTRVGEIKNALGWFLEILGIEEDARTFTSTLAGETPPGFIPQIIPGANVTGLVFLDAPLLDLADLNLDTHSNAYIAFRAFSDSWPGATAYRSPDDLNFDPVATSNQEAAAGKLTTPPGTWARSGDGSFRNVIQEVADGGTMTIKIARRAEAFQTKTETEVLNGANSIAMVTSSGVEILQFVERVVNDDGSLTLNRLLRGRLGTEDVTDADASAAGDFVVFLEAGPVAKQKLLINQLGLFFIYRGVTVGTFIEDTPSISASYDGRDLLPFSVVDIASAAGSPDGLDITWTRRARGPYIGSLSLTPPVNETQLLYRARLKNSSGTVVQTKDVTTETVHFSAAEIAAAGSSATVEVTQVSGTGLESPVTPDSTITVS